MQVIFEWLLQAPCTAAKGRKGNTTHYALMPFKICTPWERTNAEWITKLWLLGDMWECSSQEEIFHCVQCCRLHGRLVEQKMSDLLYCRVAEAPKFTFCGVDMFGPYIIKQRWSQVKCYGVMFTCTSCRAVHIEITHFLDTDSLRECTNNLFR